jgi:hypothetical protein
VELQIAWFGEPQSPDGAHWRCASLLKPLLFWVAADALPRARWVALARPAVTLSANAPTVVLWEALGASWLLDALAERTGVRWALEPGGRRAFGRVLVNAGEVARAYAALAADPGAAEVVSWMREVPGEQTFGVRWEPDVAVKAGWFLDRDETALRTHVVAFADAARGVVVLSRVPVPEAVRSEYAERYREGSEVLALHERYAGAVLRGAVSRRS